MPTDKKRGKIRGEMPVGFYIPGVLAAVMAQASEPDYRRKTVIGGFMGIQSELKVTCSMCSHKHTPTIWSEDDADRLYKLALEKPYTDLLSQLEQEYTDNNFVCPNCGTRARLCDHC